MILTGFGVVAGLITAAMSARREESKTALPDGRDKTMGHASVESEE